MTVQKIDEKTQHGRDDMALKFPHVRLFMRNLLVEGAGCSEVIAATAYEHGLIPLEAIARVESAEYDNTCSCMSASRQVLSESVACGAKAGKLESKLDEIWSSVNARVSAKLNTGGLSSKPHCCKQSAPVLFDILLQELSRY